MNGPSFGAPSFDPNAVGSRPVGTLTFSASQVSNATLSYTMKFATNQVGGCVYNGRLGGMRRTP